jgi:cobalt-zinc-cadmium efflux system outer membrane protein
MRIGNILLTIGMVALTIGAVAAAATPSRAATAQSDAGLTLEELIDAAMEANPQVASARARWFSALHSIKQNYAPADPVFNYFNIDSPTNGFTQAAAHTINVTDSFQFPGKALLQADNARRTAEIARLMYAAAKRDLRAAVGTAYYQALLDSQLVDVASEMLDSLRQVVKVAQVAYTAGRVTQTDFITAELNLSSEQITANQLQVAHSNDLTAINQLLYRQPDAPLNLDRTLRLPPLTQRMDDLVNRAITARQEILEAALAEHNAATAQTLAKMEYLPDYSVGYTFDNYLIPSAGPTLNSLQDHGWNIGFNIPVFFWLKQREDVTRSGFDRAAAESDLASARSQTAATVTTLYRSAQFAYQTANTYHDILIPLARQNFVVALTAYTSGKVDFLTLSSTLQQLYNTRISYLQAANQYLAGRVALEQAIGEPLGR